MLLFLQMPYMGHEFGASVPESTQAAATYPVRAGWWYVLALSACILALQFAYMQASGVPTVYKLYDGTCHGFIQFPGAQSYNAIRDIAAELRSAFGMI